MIINHNINAMNSHRNLSFNVSQSGKSSEKLSSGYRINRAADDAAGLAISEKMRAQLRSMNQGMRNTQDGISLVQATEGALNEVSDMLGRMKELATQAANSTYSDTDVGYIKDEVDRLISQIDDIAAKTEFNGRTTLDGQLGATFTIQTGGKITDAIVLDFTQVDMTNLTNGIGPITDNASAATELANIDTAIETVNKARSYLGAYQNQMEHSYNNSSVNAENLQAAESRIRDTDMAAEMMKYTKFNILQQASTAMLAQANQAPQGVLQLLR
ncbi:flagellin [Cohnella terricola]|uniref:Flagellin n=1 Tax=Cohnella terricola TaxID=1289167 RepID=A0A559J8D2_9BACL|nr:flagellin [Cohnella terricola]TVX96107.1 flagellin [Cohnella terricola]